MDQAKTLTGNFGAIKKSRCLALHHKAKPKNRKESERHVDLWVESLDFCRRFRSQARSNSVVGSPGPGAYGMQAEPGLAGKVVLSF